MAAPSSHVSCRRDPPLLIGNESHELAADHAQDLAADVNVKHAERTGYPLSPAQYQQVREALQHDLTDTLENLRLPEEGSA